MLKEDILEIKKYALDKAISLAIAGIHVPNFKGPSSIEEIIATSHDFEGFLKTVKIEQNGKD